MPPIYIQPTTKHTDLVGFKLRTSIRQTIVTPSYYVYNKLQTNTHTHIRNKYNNKLNMEDDNDTELDLKPPQKKVSNQFIHTHTYTHSQHRLLTCGIFTFSI
jgi:hypothetical protein